MADTDNWDGPTPSRGSFLDPAGPFRPLRRLVTYLTLLGILGVVLGGVLFASDPGGGGLIVAFYAGSATGTLFTAWGSLWILDTVLAFLKH